MDFEKARFYMIEQQIRPWDVLDQRVLDLLAEVKREDFVPAGNHSLAFVDMELPLPTGGKMLQPKVEARIVQEMDIQPSDVVLEVGTGSGYLTALLARSARHVYSLDISAQAIEIAQANLARADIRNVTLEVANGGEGDTAHAPYNVIVIGGSLPVLPEALKAQLAPGGRLFATIGDEPVMRAIRVVRDNGGQYREETLFDTVIDPLFQISEPERFVF